MVLLTDDPLSILGSVSQWLHPCSFDSPIGNLFSSTIQNLKLHDEYRLLSCVPSTRTLRLHCKIQNNIFKKTKAGHIARGNHQHSGIDYSESIMPFMCLESLHTLLGLPSVAVAVTNRRSRRCISTQRRRWRTCSSGKVEGDSWLTLLQYSALRPKRMGRSVSFVLTLY